MSTINPFAEFSLSRGLDSVTHLKTENTPKTVDFFNLDPSDIAKKPQLEQLLATSNMGSFLEDKLRPQLNNRELLLPNRFRQALAKMKGRFKRASEKKKNGNKALSRAAQMLNEEDGLLDLLQMYRSTLYQG